MRKSVNLENDNLKREDLRTRLALYKFQLEMLKGEKSVAEEGTVSSQELRKELEI
ncbi:MAG: hypothetical protein PUG16_07960 [Lachnospiraceae bacterium]|nr:hypothetical protein [Lachnospiraceae bacterium]